MKTTHLLTVPILSAVILLTSCRSEQGPRPHRPSPAATTAAPKSAVAPPYYQTDADGSYYYSTGEVTNEDYHPGKLRRNHPVRR